MNVRRLTAACVVGIFGVVGVFAAQRSASAAPIKLSVGAATTASTWNYGTIPEDVTDGNRDGAYGNGSVWHSTDPNPLAWLQIDLRDTYYLDRIQIFPRRDAIQHTVENFRLSLYADNGAGQPGTIVWSGDFNTNGQAANQNWGTTAMRGQSGRFVKFERLDAAPPFTTFAELEVWGQSRPIEENNLALTGTITGSPGGFGTVLQDAADDDINGAYGHIDQGVPVGSTHPVYHSDTAAVGQYWQVDFGAMKSLDYIQLFSRSDGQTTGPVRVSILDAAQSPVATYDVNLAGTELGAIRYDQLLPAARGVQGQYVRVETLAAQFLAPAEVQVMELPAGYRKLDLADIVGGGDGTGTGGDQGIVMATGQSTTLHRPDLNGGPVNEYHLSPLPFVDGVFVPDSDIGGGPIDIEVSSTGLEVSGIADTNSVSYDEIWNGNNEAVSGGFNTASRIGMHASKGITFDLNAIEAANSGMQVTAFTAHAGVAHAQGNAILYAIVDGRIVDSFNAAGTVYKTMSIELPDDARFLTLLTSSNGSDGADWSYFADPLLTLEPVPEPSGLLLLLVALPAWLVWRRRSA